MFRRIFEKKCSLRTKKKNKTNRSRQKSIQIDNKTLTP